MCKTWTNCMPTHCNEVNLCDPCGDNICTKCSESLVWLGWGRGDATVWCLGVPTATNDPQKKNPESHEICAAFSPLINNFWWLVASGSDSKIERSHVWWWSRQVEAAAQNKCRMQNSSGFAYVSWNMFPSQKHYVENHARRVIKHGNLAALQKE